MSALEVIKIMNRMIDDMKYIKRKREIIVAKAYEIIDKNIHWCHNISVKGLVIKMYQNKIELSPQDILEKDFKIDTRGYRLKEVDQYLDIIINDYEQFYAMINDLEKEKADLLGEVMRLKQEIRNMKMNAEIAKNSSSDIPEVTNLDLLRRLSKLEKMVYGKDD